MTRQRKGGQFGALVLLAAVVLRGASSLPTASLADVLARARHQESVSSRRLQDLDPVAMRRNITVAEEAKEEEKEEEEEEKAAGEEGHMDGLLEYLELETLDAEDPRMRSPDGLTLLSHSGNALTFTKGSAGQVSLNGAPVEGVQTLPDGTEVYTLERFLEDHKGRLDEAFRFLSQQANRLQPQSRHLATDLRPGAQELRIDAAETASQVPRPVAAAKVPQPHVVVSEVTEISSEISAPVTSITLTKFSMSSLLDKPAPSSKTGSAFEKTVPFKSANDVEPQSVTEALFVTLFEEEPVPQTEMPAITSSAEADPATGFVYEPSPEEPIPVTESVFISRQDSDGVTEAFEPAFVEPVPATETVWDPSTEEAIAVTSISMKSSSMDRKQGTKILPELATGIPLTELTEETAPEDLSSQTEILFETTSPEPVDEQEEQTELSSRTLTPVTETPFEVSSIEPAPITESLFKSLQKPLPTTESMDELSEDLVLKNIADSIQGHLGTSVAVSKEELSTTPFLETEFSFDSHENIIPRTELPFAGSAESLPKAKVVAEIPLEAQPEEIPQIEVATTLSPLEPIDVDSSRANFTVEAETQFASANETTEAPEVLLNHSQEFAEVKLVLPQHTLDTNIYPENLFKAERQEDAIPQIPASTEEINIALLDIWREALSYTETDTSGAAIGVPSTILTPDYITMVNLVPQDAPHPLYGDAPETAALRREFLLDYLVLEPLDFQDPRMTQPEGLVVTNLGGKELAFSLDANDNLTVDGVSVEGVNTLSDGTVVFTLSDFLFDHRLVLEEVFQTLARSGGGLFDQKHGLAAVPEVTLTANETSESTQTEEENTVVSTDAPTTTILPVPLAKAVDSKDSSLNEVTVPVEESVPIKESILVEEKEVNVAEISLVTEESHPSEGVDNATGTPQQSPQTEEQNATGQALEPEQPTSLTEPLLTLPRIPQLVEEGESSSLLNLWRHALRHQDASATLRDTREPKTLVSPDYFIVMNLVPQDAPHPLYDDAPEHVALRTEFLLDYLVLDPINVQDPEISSPEGISVTNLAGKKLTFAADPQGKISINGVPVEMVEILEDGTQVYTVEDLLFDHRARVDDAFLHLISQPAEFGPLGEPLDIPVPPAPTKDFFETPLPKIPHHVDAEDSSSLLNLWRHALREQDPSLSFREDTVPKTILSPDFLEMGNLVPQDAPHPLYDDSPKNVALRNEFLLDYLVRDPINVQDPNISTSGGIAVENLAGHQLSFMANSQGKLTINGVPVKMIEILKDGTQVYTLADFLFEHRARVDDAFLHLISQPAEFGPLGEPLGVPTPPEPPAEILIGGSSLTVPRVPKFVEERESSSLLSVWRHALKLQDSSTSLRDDREPATVLSPDFFEMANLVPQDGPHPLYDDGPENAVLRTEILLDYLVLEPVEVHDPRMLFPEALNVTNLGGKELSFVRHEDGRISVNGVPVEAVEVLDDGTLVYTLATFLFDHRHRVQEAFDKLAAQSGKSRRMGDLALQDSPHVIPESTQPLQKSTQTVKESTQLQQETTQETSRPQQETTQPLQKETQPQQETNQSQQETTQQKTPQPEEETAQLTTQPQQETTAPQEEPTQPRQEETPQPQEESSAPSDETNQQPPNLDREPSQEPPQQPPQVPTEAQDVLLQPVPRIPQEVDEGEYSSLLNLWRYALSEQDFSTSLRDDRVPQTILSPDFLVMMNLVPQDAPHPLYDDALENVALRLELLLDYLVLERVSAQDPRMTQPEGLTVTNFAGKEVTFRVNSEGNMTINGVDVEAAETLQDGTAVFTLADVLFRHRQRVEEAFVTLLERSSPVGGHFAGAFDTPITPESPIDTQTEALTVPRIPQTVDEGEVSSLLNLWRHALRLQGTAATLRDDRVPKTILSPDFLEVVNLVPQDAPHPLYDDAPKNEALRAEFLLDYLVLEPVDAQDPRIASPEGLTVTNLGGKPLTFTADSEGHFLVNGVPVEAAEALEDGTQVYTLADFLFEHRARVDEAFLLLISQPAEFGPLGEPLDIPTPGPSATVKEVDYPTTVPRIPKPVDEEEASSLLNLWRHALRMQDSSATFRDDREPKTLLSPDFLEVVNLVPQDAPHPLYDDAPENIALLKEILLDYMILEPLNIQNPRTTQSGGLRVTNLGGKELVFIVDDQDNLVINGITVEALDVLPDGTQVFTLTDFLFDHRERVNEAFQRLTNQPSLFTPLGEPLDLQAEGQPALKTAEQIQESVPEVPIAEETPDQQVVIVPESGQEQKSFDQASVETLQPLREREQAPEETVQGVTESDRALSDSLQTETQSVKTLPGSVETLPEPEAVLAEAGRGLSGSLQAVQVADQAQVVAVSESDLELLESIQAVPELDLAEPESVQIVPGIYSIQSDPVQVVLETDEALLDPVQSVPEADHTPSESVQIETVSETDETLLEPLQAEPEIDQALPVPAYDQEALESAQEPSELAQVVPETEEPKSVPAEIETEQPQDLTATESAHSLPRIPKIVDEGEASSLLNIWRHALMTQDASATLRDDREPKTILSPDFLEVVNLVPQDAPHPLYDDAPENIALRQEFLLDYMVLDPIDVQDPRISTAEGLNVTNLAGKTLSFAVDPEGNLRINSVPVQMIEILEDDTQVYTLADFLFEHRARVDDAFLHLISQPAEFGPLGEPLDGPSIQADPLSEA
ncbi:uncharacterized protein LOC122265196 isoform X2 [Penaeus japonicus]|uniref:uncharacterized protein LOC122265196 isoform X2 n=1 Tax=Penaeus japonicus TaxID=27405 RepID=UPI001C70DB54|nr:uncharacterized protein LOC122265196 isoform X2 [Penaeus japonicus]